MSAGGHNLGCKYQNIASECLLDYMFFCESIGFWVGGVVLRVCKKDDAL